MTSSRVAKPAFEVAIVARGFDEEPVVDYAKERIYQAARAAPAPVLFARLKLQHEPHRSVERPWLAESMLDVNGRAVRAHVAAETLHEAIDFLERRLRRKLEDLQHRREFVRSLAAAPSSGEWRHSDLPAQRPVFFSPAS